MVYLETSGYSSKSGGDVLINIEKDITYKHLLIFNTY